MDSFELNSYLVIHDKKGFLSYLRKNHLTKEKLLVSHFQKKDLFTKEPLEYKNEDQYLGNDFNNRENLNNYLLSITKEKAREFCVNFFNKRKSKKSLIYLPSEIELKSYIAPSINIIQKGLGFDYNQFAKDCELICRFKYKSSFKTNNLGTMKIIQDTREQKPLKLDNIEIRKLDIGDYTVLPPYYSNIYVERKSLPDFIGTLSPKNIDRFKNELIRVKQMGTYLVVVIEEKFSNLLHMKDFKHIRSKASPDYILHKMREIMESSNLIQFLFVDGREESARIIKKIFRLGESIRELDLTYAYDGGKI